MSCVIRSIRQGTDYLYLYRSYSYWVPGVGPRNKRTLLGRLDPATGAILPTRTRGAKPKKQAEQVQQVSEVPQSEVNRALQQTRESLIQETAKCLELETTVQELKARVRDLEKKLSSITSCVEIATSVVQRQMEQCASIVRESQP